MADSAAVQEATAAVEDPLLHRSLGELGMVRDLKVGRRGAVDVRLGAVVPDHPSHQTIRDRVIEAVGALDGVKSVTVGFELMTDSDRQMLMERLVPEKKVIGASASRTRVIGIASGKGGVGKSSVTSNLAVTLAALGHSVGVIDADVWGFSIPRMLGAGPSPVVIHESIIPPEAHGVKVMSMDFFVGDQQAVIWRGPMLHKAIEQFLTDVFWDDPDFLLIDMPPGTGDIAISLSQFLPRAQMLVVTTPQPTAQRVAKRAALMAEKVNQEVMAIVENMSWFTGDDGKRYEIFGSGGGQALATELGIPLVAQIPLLPVMRAGADDGRPLAVVAPDSEAAQAFSALAKAVIELLPRVRTHPELVIT